MASRAASFSKSAYEDDGVGVAAAAAHAAEAASLPLLLAPVAALSAWIDAAAPSCGMPALVGPREDGPEHAMGESLGADALVYGELSLGALAAALCEHARELAPPGAEGATFVDLGSGTGKSLLLAALCPFIATAIGVEVVVTRHASAVALAVRFEQSFLAAARPGGGVRLALRCGSFLDDDAEAEDADNAALSWRRHADFVLCNWLLWPASLRAALEPSLAALRAGALVATVARPLRHPAFRLLSARHVAVSWGHADLLLHRRMPHGAAWQRRRAAPGRAGDAADCDELLCSADALRAAGVLSWLGLDQTAAAAPRALLLVGCGDSALPAQLHARLRRDGVAVHACDLEPAAIRRQRAHCCGKDDTSAGAAPQFAVADVLDLPLHDATWRRLAAAAPAKGASSWSEDDAASDSSSVASSSDSDAEDDDAAAEPPRLFEALLDQCSLDVLPSLAGGAGLTHRALCALSASLAPRDGVAVLLSARPPAAALPMLTAHPALRWRVTPERLSVTEGAPPLYAYVCRALDAPEPAAWSPGSGLCSLAACGKAAFAQRWWECATCVQEAVCAACAAAGCHAGHALAPAPPPREGCPERGFCDCGFSGRCRAGGVPPLPPDADDAPLPRAGAV